MAPILFMPIDVVFLDIPRGISHVFFPTTRV